MNRLANLGMTKALIVQNHAQYMTGRMLDVGCGSKPFARLAIPCTEYVGLDIRPVGEIQADIVDWCEPESYDSVMCVDMLQYATDPAKAMQNMVDAMRPNATLMLIAPHTQAEDESSLWSFKVRGIVTLLEGAGLAIDDIKTFSKLWDAEFANFRGVDKFGFAMPAEIDGLIGFLDNAYPAWVFALAHKP